MKPFSVKLLNERISVKFIYPNDKVVVCMIEDGKFSFKGIAKCNFDEGDVFDKKQGEKLAFKKAWDKRDNKIKKMIQAALMKMVKEFDTQQSFLYDCFINRQGKQDKPKKDPADEISYHEICDSCTFSGECAFQDKGIVNGCPAYIESMPSWEDNVEDVKGECDE